MFAIMAAPDHPAKVALMTEAPRTRPGDSHLRTLTQNWGSYAAVALYLERCQVLTPSAVVSEVWQQVHKRRQRLGKVVDFGAGDGRFAEVGEYEQYVGYEIDAELCRRADLPSGARLVNACAFSEALTDADLCIGNPPYVRNQDLPADWRKNAATSIQLRTGVRMSGLANAWQYFTLLSLASTKADGLLATVIPYEWVSRPSSRPLRRYIADRGWDVAVYRLPDPTFDRVLTTSSITLIDKRQASGSWCYFEREADGPYRRLMSPSGGKHGVLRYASRSPHGEGRLTVRRGLSPGTQRVLTLTDGERIRAGLRIGTDVVACVTSLRFIDAKRTTLSEALFDTRFRSAGVKCWLPRTDREPSDRLRSYLDHIPATEYQTRTCLDRDPWWRFSMPAPPSVLIATGFRTARPKALANEVGAVAVGGVSGVYGLSATAARRLVQRLRSVDLNDSVVRHSKGLRKLESGQLVTLVNALL